MLHKNKACFDANFENRVSSSPHFINGCYKNHDTYNKRLEKKIQTMRHGNLCIKVIFPFIQCRIRHLPSENPLWKLYNFIKPLRKYLYTQFQSLICYMSEYRSIISRMGVFYGLTSQSGTWHHYIRRCVHSKCFVYFFTVEFSFGFSGNGADGGKWGRWVGKYGTATGFTKLWVLRSTRYIAVINHVFLDPETLT